MTVTPYFRLARQTALGVPTLMIGGALISQYGFGLFPCEMCMWQRYPHYAAIGLGLLAYFVAPKRMWTAIAGLAILASGLIGGFHAGVEYHWWEGITQCAAAASGTGSAIDAITSAPMVRCDAAPWDLFGISLAGWNFLLSTAAGILVLGLLGKDKRI